MISRSRDAREGPVKRGRPLQGPGLRALCLMLVATILASACTAITPPYRGRDFRPTLPAPAMPAEQNKGGLYQEGHALLLFEDAKARAVGDTITIILRERTDATKSSNASAGKSTSIARRRQATFPWMLRPLTGRWTFKAPAVRISEMS